jgi:tRNA pseudouridine38-40 synthase
LRYFIKFSYNGTLYHGWQSQPNANSVQETLTKAMRVLLSIPIALTGAGRTDTGVHAKEMFAHFDCETTFDANHLVYKLNAYLPKDIVVFDIIPVHEKAHARFDAVQRTYEYHIHTFKDAFLEGRSWYYHHELDLDLMNEAAGSLLNYTDFQSFSKVNTDVNTFNCTITEAFWKQNGNNLVFTITADRFLRNMVRAIVGTLVYIGLKKINIDDLKKIIESRNRKNAGFSVPAHGLYLTKVVYNYITVVSW